VYAATVEGHTATSSSNNVNTDSDNACNSVDNAVTREPRRTYPMDSALLPSKEQPCTVT
jgi:hypothetical protein